jgi:hypothetical protein
VNAMRPDNLILFFTQLGIVGVDESYSYWD